MKKLLCIMMILGFSLPLQADTKEKVRRGGFIGGYFVTAKDTQLLKTFNASPGDFIFAYNGRFINGYGDIELIEKAAQEKRRVRLEVLPNFVNRPSTQAITLYSN